MQFSINRNEFIKYTNNVQRAISNRTTIPILTGILLKLSDEGLTITGSDSDISITSFISKDNTKSNLKIESTGSIVLPAKFFNEIIKKLPGDEFTLNVIENFQTIITSDQSEFIINGLDSNNYPNLPEVSREDTLTIDKNLFTEMVNQTVVAVSSQESRPVLTGVNIRVKDNQLLAVATDSHRLAQRTIPVKSNNDYDIIVPGKSLLELTRIIPESLDQISIYISENQILFNLSDTLFYSRLLEGNYPDTDRLIPNESTTKVIFSATDLLASVERASLLSHESRNNVVKMNVKNDDKSVTIYGNSPEVGTVEEVVKTNSIEGEDIEISFNPDYLKDALKSIGNADINLNFSSPLHPFTVIPENNSDFIQLITPIRTY